MNIWPCHDDRDTRTHIYILAGRKYIYFRQSEIYISWLTFSFLLASGICLSLQAFITIFNLYTFIRRDNHSSFKKTQKERNNIVRAGYRNLKINQGNASGKKITVANTVKRHLSSDCSVFAQKASSECTARRQKNLPCLPKESWEEREKLSNIKNAPHVCQSLR